MTQDVGYEALERVNEASANNSLMSRSGDALLLEASTENGTKSSVSVLIQEPG